MSRRPGPGCPPGGAIAPLSSLLLVVSSAAVSSHVRGLPPDYSCCQPSAPPPRREAATHRPTTHPFADAMSHQDWAPVVLKKKAPSSGTTVTNVDAARRAGAQVAAIKKCAWPLAARPRRRRGWSRAAGHGERATRGGGRPRGRGRGPQRRLSPAEAALSSRCGQQRARHGRAGGGGQQAGRGDGRAAPCAAGRAAPVSGRVPAARSPGPSRRRAGQQRAEDKHHEGAAREEDDAGARGVEGAPPRPHAAWRPPPPSPAVLSQAQLAQLINELPKVVQDYEAGKAIPNQQARERRGTAGSVAGARSLSTPQCLASPAARCVVQIISKMEKALGVPLRPKKK